MRDVNAMWAEAEALRTATRKVRKVVRNVEFADSPAACLLRIRLARLAVLEERLAEEVRGRGRRLTY